MAKRRLINTKFWSDTYVSDLDPSEKLLFIYFLSNPYTNISGAYEISLRQVALDTGFDKEIVEKILRRFERDDKILFIDGYVVIKNFIKHQELNPKVLIGIENEVKVLPKSIQTIVYDSLSHLNTNSNLIKSKETTEKKAEKAKAYLLSLPSEDIKQLTTKYEVSERQVKSKAEDLFNYCLSKAKFYSDYKAFLTNAVKKDFGLRPIKKEISPPKVEEDVSPEVRKLLKEQRESITKQFTLKRVQS